MPRRKKRKRRAEPTTKPGRVMREQCVKATVPTKGRKKRKVIVECAEPEVIGQVKAEGCFEVSPGNEACVCGVTYDKFRALDARTAWKEAWWALKKQYETSYDPSPKRVRALLGKMKREQWELHQQSCTYVETPEEKAYWETFEWVEPEESFEGLGRLRRVPWFALLGVGAIVGATVWVVFRR